MYFAFHKQPRARVADFALAVKNSVYRAFDGVIDVGIGEDNVWRFPAELKRDAFQCVRCRTHDFFADGGRTGEGNLVDSGMTDDCFARLWPASHDVQHARGYPGFDGQISESECSQRRLLRGFHHNGAAASEGRADFPGSQEKRKVPRDDQSDYADRFTKCVGEGALKRIHRLAVNFRRQAGVVTEDVHHHRHVDVLGLEDRFAVVERLEFGEFVDVLLNQISQPPQQASALAGGHLVPWTGAVFESVTSGFNCSVDIIWGGFNDLGQDLAGGRIDGVEFPGAVNPLAVDQEATGGYSRFGSCNHC